MSNYDDGYENNDLHSSQFQGQDQYYDGSAAAGSYRVLAGSSEAVKIDYNVLSVAAMTLALILMVEVFRHKLDHAALQRPFFQAVLENIYAECEYLFLHP